MRQNGATAYDYAIHAGHAEAARYIKTYLPGVFNM